MPCKPTLASRGEGRLANKSALLEMLCCIFENLYDPQRNPAGAVSLGVAENSLMHADLKKFCESHFEIEPNDLTYGTSLKGSPRLFAALSRLYASPRFGSIWNIEARDMVLGSGVGALLDQSISMICDRGDAVLIAAPFYAGFTKDVGSRNGAQLVHVEVGAEPAGAHTLKAFETKLDELQRAGTKTRAIILCNPHNPLGFCYPRETIIEYARFAEKHDVFLISDEIYGLSVFESDQAHPKPFVSVLSIDVENEAGCDMRRVLHLYGASKDFGLNGLRIGALVSKNQELLDGFTASAMWLKVSSASDALFSALLNDRAGLDHFVAENARRLAQAYTFVTDFFKRHNIPYKPSCAGHFVFVDFRSFLPTHDANGKVLSTEAEKEAALFLLLLNRGVYVAPGAFYKYHQSGWFRLTFTVCEDVMQIGLDRIAQALGLDGAAQPKMPATPVRPRSGVAVSDVADELGALSVGCLACMC